ncbi:hypothetical protein ACROYT_G044538 [Oculina patagonica]
MRFTVIVLHLAIMAIGLAQAEDFMCPSCVSWEPNAEEKCGNELKNTPCGNEDQPQCFVYKDERVFIRTCPLGKNYEEELQKCAKRPHCQMGRCFTSGCLATFGDN